MSDLSRSPTYTENEFIRSDTWRERFHNYADQFLSEYGGRWADLPHDFAEAIIAEFLSDLDTDLDPGAPGLDISVRALAQLIGLIDEDGEWR